MHQRGKATRRSGFTFVELLMVILIIAVLAALLLGGITKVMALQARTEAMSDITQMAQSLEAAKTAYGHIEFLPSRLQLHRDISRYRDPSADLLTKGSANVLRYMFGKRLISNGTMVTWIGPTGPLADGAILSGSECLVFYLGGVPDMTGGGIRFIGFGKDPLNPMAPTTDRIGPFYNFRPNRLIPGPGGFFQYLDPFGKNQPYAYFGPGGVNMYNEADCAHLLGAPYFEVGSNPRRYLNPKTFQIISAGPDGRFGPGGPLDVRAGSTEVNTVDNLANFSSSELGNPVE